MKRKPCFEEISGFNDRWLVVAGLPIASLLVSLLIFGDAYQRMDWSFMVACIPVSFIYTCFFWLGMRWIYTELKWRYPANDAIGKRALWVFLGFNVLFFIIDTGVANLLDWLGLGHKIEPSIIVTYIASLILSALVITLYEAISFYIQLQRTVAENAIKHNVISTEKPLTIEVFAENGHLVVRNNLQLKNQVMDSTGVGLQNIRDRYRMLTNSEVEIIHSVQYFTVLLPAIELLRA